MKKVLLIDGFGIIFKSYYAFINRPLTNANGENTSAIYGFFKSLISVLKKENPDYYLIAFEGEGECFRNKIYPEYKANRPPAPEDLKSQIPKIINLVKELNIPHLNKDGFEADDIIGTISKITNPSQDKMVLIFSSDKDLTQLVNEKTLICHPDRFSDTYKKLDEAAVLKKMQVKPSQIIDYLALTGDSSDNIPGVKGIGPKTAASLLEEWKTLDSIYENIEKISSKTVKTKLEQNKENAFLSKKLAEIDQNIEITPDWDNWITKPLTLQNAQATLEKNSLKSIVSAIEEYNLNTFGEKKTVPDLFNQDENNNSLQNAKPIEKKEYKIITDIKDLNNKISKIKKTGHFCFDLETTGFDFLSDQIICISIGIKDETFVIPMHISETQQEELKIKIDSTLINAFLNALKILFEDKNILKIGHNIKFDIKFLTTINIETNGNLFDTMLAEYCLDASYNILSMDDLAAKYLSHNTIHYKDVVKDTKKNTLQDVTMQELTEYSGQDADITYKLYKVLKEKIAQNKKTEALFYEIEMPLLKILTDMEYYGVRIDKEYLASLSIELEKESRALLEKLINIAGEEFNPNSPKQIAEILFTKFELPVIKKTKTGPSTDVEVLKKLSYIHPIASTLLEYRTITKIKSTYSDSLPSMINPVSNKIHTTYLQTGTQTGRLASKNPNLQNIPIKTEIGRKIRQGFIPSKNNILISADYSQIELFLLGEFSKDPNLFDAFKNNKDIHTKTASLIFEKKEDEIESKERTIGKTINFSILYGQGAHRLSENLEISRKEAAEFISKYFTNYSGISEYMQKIKEKCRETGYVETYWGRKRSIPEIFDQNKMRQANGERMAVNTTIQGTAADLIKISMIRIIEKFRLEKIKSKLIMQVHDELIFDVIPDEKEIVIKIIKENMEQGFDFELQLKTSLKAGNNWGELK